jgi:hypothetical protein
MSSLQTKVQQNIDLLNFVILHSIINNLRHEKYLHSLFNKKENTYKFNPQTYCLLCTSLQLINWSIT